MKVLQNDDADDIIILGESTDFQPMCWQFPQTRKCPKDLCFLDFSSRAIAIKHYRERHAKFDLLCKECGVLISMSGAHNMTNHYKRKHPDRIPPQKWDKQQDAVGSLELLGGEQLQLKPKQGHSIQKPSMDKPRGILKRRCNVNEESNSDKKVSFQLKCLLEIDGYDVS